MLANRNGLGAWLERLIIAALALVFLGSVDRAFFSPLLGHLGLQTFSQLNRLATILGQEPDPVQREKSTPDEDPGVGASYRAIDARCPANARLFLAGMLGRENFSQIGYYRYLTYYLFPREIAISLGETPALHLDWVEGRSPSSAEEVRQAGYDFVMKFAAGQTRLMFIPLGGGQHPPEAKPKPIPSHDWIIALLLPLAVAVAGSRIVRWLFERLAGHPLGRRTPGQWHGRWRLVHDSIDTRLALGWPALGAGTDCAHHALGGGGRGVGCAPLASAAVSIQPPSTVVAAVGAGGPGAGVPVPAGGVAGPPGI